MKQNETTPAEMLTARHFKTIHKSEDRTFCICLYTINKGKETVSVIGNNLPEVPYDVTFSGKWITSQKYGKQFQVDMVTERLPKSESDVIRFITSLKIGIGAVKAKQMLTMTGLDNFWSELRRDPLQFCDIKGLRRDSITALQKKIEKEGLQTELFQLFGADLGCDSRQYKKICALFKNDGKQMIKDIKDNPFILMKCGYTFKELDYFCNRRTDYEINDKRRLLAAAQQVLLNARQESHVALPAQILEAGMQEQLQAQGSVHPADIQKFLSFANTEETVICSGDLYYLPRYYQEEIQIANVLTDLIQKPIEKVDKVRFLKTMAEYEKEKGFQLSDNQEQAVLTALERSVCIITGGPGTGKSTILDALLHCWKEFHDDHWLLMAPTGKAAVRMTETTGQPATTIHSSLGLNVGRENIDEMDTWVQDIESSLIVVDECSMIDQTVMASLSMALSKDKEKTQHIVLVGDPDQLPSVGPGNILADCIEAGEVPVCRLSTIYRQGAGNPIITNSTRIREGEVKLDWTNTSFRGYYCGSDEKNIEAACKFYLKNVEKYGVENVVILSPYHRATALSTNALNKRLQEAVNPSLGRFEVTSMGRAFRVNDRVMQTRNNYELIWKKIDGSMSGSGVFNGDTGTVVSIDKNAEIVTVSFDDRLVEYTFSQLEELEHAYAVTVHKSQGCQWRVVILLLPNKTTDFLRRNILYTAITRSQEFVAVFGPESTVAFCIQNDKLNDRYTNLTQRLKTA